MFVETEQQHGKCLSLQSLFKRTMALEVMHYLSSLVILQGAIKKESSCLSLMRKIIYIEIMVLLFPYFPTNSIRTQTSPLW